jgi:hypothetical protein
VPTPLKLKMVSEMPLSTNFTLLSLKPHSTPSSLQRDRCSSSQVFSPYTTTVALPHVSVILANTRPCNSAQNVRLITTKLMGQPCKQTPIILCLWAMVVNFTYAKKMQYQSNHVHDPTKVTNIFNGTHYTSLLGKFITIGNEELPASFFSDS